MRKKLPWPNTPSVPAPARASSWRRAGADAAEAAQRGRLITADPSVSLRSLVGVVLALELDPRGVEVLVRASVDAVVEVVADADGPDRHFAQLGQARLVRAADLLVRALRRAQGVVGLRGGAGLASPHGHLLRREGRLRDVPPRVARGGEDHGSGGALHGILDELGELLGVLLHGIHELLGVLVAAVHASARAEVADRRPVLRVEEDDGGHLLELGRHSPDDLQPTVDDGGEVHAEARDLRRLLARRRRHLDHPVRRVPQAAHVVRGPRPADGHHAAVGAGVVDARHDEAAEVLPGDWVVEGELAGLVPAAEQRRVLTPADLVEHDGADDVGVVRRRPHDGPLHAVGQAPHQLAFDAELVELAADRRLVHASVGAVDEVLDATLPRRLDDVVRGHVVDIVDVLLVRDLRGCQERDAARGLRVFHGPLDVGRHCDVAGGQGHAVLDLQLLKVALGPVQGLRADQDSDLQAAAHSVEDHGLANVARAANADD
mmetsp:Transcript_18278/g.41328  ORF Transcript_18278/g.41328 Transcript_18278/m.41328 type:complete len:490 (+) Transcript_18278:120-1589(+)